jgi:hypothetical protein
MGKLLREIAPTPQKPGLIPIASTTKQALSNPDGLQADKTLDGFFLMVNSLQILEMDWQNDERWTSQGDKCRQQVFASVVRQVEGPTICLEGVLSPLHNETMEFRGGNPLGEGGTQSMKKIEDAPLFLVNLRGGPLKFAKSATGSENDDAEHDHRRKEGGDYKSLDTLKDHVIQSCDKIAEKTSSRRETLSRTFSQEMSPDYWAPPGVPCLR